MAAPMLRICLTKFPVLTPFLCRGKASKSKPWLKHANTLSGTRRYRGPVIKMEEIRTSQKRNVPLFFGQRETHHPVEQAGGSLSWAEPIFKAHRDRLEKGDEETKQASQIGEKVYPLHAVQRVPKTLYGVQKKLKKIMKALGLHSDQVPNRQFVILPNTEVINEYLQEVKSIVKIMPLKYDGPELSDDDIGHMYLTEDAELIVRHKVHGLDVVDEGPADKWAIEKDTIVVRNRRRIQEQRVSLEYFPPKYIYRYNQDGKEYRYTHNTGEYKPDSSTPCD